MSERRLTDEELADLLGDNELRQGDAYMTAHEAVSLLAELRQRRAAGLSADEREALRWARAHVAQAVPESKDPACYPSRALAVLAKLTGGGK